MRIAVVIGTRPEAIKMAPVVFALKAQGIEACVISTGQHNEMLDQAFQDFTIVPQIHFKVMSPNQTLSSLSSRLLEHFEHLFSQEHFDWVLVQGDTTSAMIGSLAAYYHQIPVGHVEAGLRSFDNYSPFPEEGNRKLISMLATLHFAPTTIAQKHLKTSGVSEETIFLTGNTIVDALLWMRNRLAENYVYPSSVQALLGAHKRIICVTCHRRENFGQALEDICEALSLLVERFSDVGIVFPVHLNPRVQDVVYKKLANNPSIALLPPVSYTSFVALLHICTIILSDSGGVQEEAPSLKKPILVLRNVTERPEGIEAGVAKLVGTDTNTILEACVSLLNDHNVYEAMIQKPNPYGDGNAAQRIVDALKNYI